MNVLEKIRKVIRATDQAKIDHQNTRLVVGSLLAKSSASAISIREAEFKVFSQFGDDGIIQFLINKTGTINHTFVEFGVETYEESNTRFLLLNNNWKGLIIDGSESNIDFIKKDEIYWQHDLTAVESFVTVENINQLLTDHGITGKIGLLSVDIDGNDYWVWEAIKEADADIVVVEYNSLFGNDRAITTPYSPSFVRQSAHYSRLYFGASLPALHDLGKRLGYAFVGCNLAGNNAYFVKKDMVPESLVMTLESGYVPSRFREARDKAGNLTYANEEQRRNEIAGLPVVNVKTGLTEAL